MTANDGDNQPEDMTVDWPAQQRRQADPAPAPDEERTTMLRNTPVPPGPSGPSNPGGRLPPIRPTAPPAGHASAQPVPPPPGYAPPPTIASQTRGYTPPPTPPAPQTGNPFVSAASAPWQSGRPTPPAGGPVGWPGTQQPAGGGYPPVPPAAAFPVASTPPPSGPRGGGSGKWWWVLGGVAAAAVVTIGAVTLIGDDSASTTTTTTAAASATTTTSTSAAPSSTPTSSAPPAGPANIDAANLAQLLLTAEEVSSRMSSPGMIPGDLTKEPAAGVNVTPADCTGVFTPGHSMVYETSGYTGFAAQPVFDPNDGIHKVIQMVASFPDAAAAQAFYQEQVADWTGCKFTTLEVAATGGAGGDTVKTGAVVNTDDNADSEYLQTILLSDGPPEKMCQRDLTVRANVIIDVRACADNPGGAAWSIMKDIGAKITGKR